MAGRKPKFKLVLKSKNTGNTQGLCAIWENEDRPGLYSGKFEDEIQQIVLKDGKVVNFNQCWINLYVNDEDNGGKHSAPSHINPNTGKAHWAESDGLPAQPETPF